MPFGEGHTPFGAPSRRLPYGAGPRFRPQLLACLSASWRQFGSSPCRAAKPTRPAEPVPSASSSRGAVVPPGGTPAPPECRRSVRLLPAGAASDPTFMTPHDSALGGPDVVEYNPISKIVNADFRCGDCFRSRFALGAAPMPQRDAACRWPASFAMVARRGRSSMVERQLPKLHTRVRFPSPAPTGICVDHNHVETGQAWSDGGFGLMVLAYSPGYHSAVSKIVPYAQKLYSSLPIVI